MSASAVRDSERVEVHQHEEVIPFRVIGDLQSGGINVSDITKLENAGFFTIGSVLQAPKRDLVNVKGLSEAKVDKILDVGRKLDVRGSPFKTGKLNIIIILFVFFSFHSIPFHLSISLIDFTQCLIIS